VRIFGQGAANWRLLTQKAKAFSLTTTDWVKPGAYVNLLNLARTWRPETLNQLDQIMIEAAAREAELE
jgi:ornithine cyclodeaminase/alanine dehydrogenase-like protein (mu-crystallin family)